MLKKTLITISLAISFIIAILSSPFLANAARTGSQSVSGYFTLNADSLNTIYYSSGPVDIGASASGIATLFVQGLSGSATSTLSVASSTGTKIFDISSTGTTTIRQYIGFGTPTVATSTGSAQSNGGTTTLAFGSTDLAGSIYLSTGSVPQNNGSIIFTFTSASSTNAFCVLQPMGTTTAAATSTFMGTTTNGFTLKSGPTALTSTTSYQWNYDCN